MIDALRRSVNLAQRTHAVCRNLGAADGMTEGELLIALALVLIFHAKINGISGESLAEMLGELFDKTPAVRDPETN